MLLGPPALWRTIKSGRHFGGPSIRHRKTSPRDVTRFSAFWSCSVAARGNSNVLNSTCNDAEQLAAGCDVTSVYGTCDSCCPKPPCPSLVLLSLFPPPCPAMLSCGCECKSHRLNYSVSILISSSSYRLLFCTSDPGSMQERLVFNGFFKPFRST